ncbi:MAG: DegQ family serine endoprotease [Chromatiales bacterium]
MTRKTILRAAIAGALLPAVTAGYLYVKSPTGAAHAESAAPGVSTAAALPDFSGLVAATGPAVVAIRVTGTAQDAGFTGLPPEIDPGSPFYEFFKHFGFPNGGDEEPMRQGIGSGFIISPDGYILTNAHVVADAGDVQVKLTDEREFKARVIGADRKSDVAVIRIDARNLPTVRVGSAKTLKVGEWVAAIGSPFGLDNTVTAGVVSAKSRALAEDSYVPFIQTDVAVNPGNSGGPLLNMKGEVVGINSQIYSRSGGYMGLSFAIPIDVAMKIGEELRHHGKVERGRLGASIQSLTQELAQSFGLDRAKGALVGAVEDGSPAARAGVAVGDVILSVNGKPINDSVELSRFIADMKPGDTATLHVIRKGEEKDLRATIGAMPSERVAANDSSGGDETGRLGLAVRPLAADEQRQLHEPGGVLVESASGPAAKAGIRPGDIILAVNSERVRNAEQLKALVNRAGKHVALLVKRDDAEIYVPIALG